MGNFYAQEFSRSVNFIFFEEKQDESQVVTLEPEFYLPFGCYKVARDKDNEAAMEGFPCQGVVTS